MSKLKVMFFPNGNTVVFRDGRQIEGLQEPWVLVYLQLLAGLGIDASDIELTMPDGRHATVFEHEGRWCVGFNLDVEKGGG